MYRSLYLVVPQRAEDLLGRATFLPYTVETPYIFLSYVSTATLCTSIYNVGCVPPYATQGLQISEVWLIIFDISEILVEWLVITFNFSNIVVFVPKLSVSSASLP